MKLHGGFVIHKVFNFTFMALAIGFKDNNIIQYFFLAKKKSKINQYIWCVYHLRTMVLSYFNGLIHIR
jgi:hypothetical protein